MDSWRVLLMAAVVGLSVAVVGCQPTTTAPAPTAAAPAAPKAAEPTKAPAAAPAATAAPAAPTAAPAKKVDFPEKGKAITLIDPAPPGGSSDVMARLLSTFLEKELGVPVAVLNKSGAAGQVAYSELAKAKPDGYTIGNVNLVAAITSYLDASRKAAYGRNDFQPVDMLLTQPMALLVKEGGKYKSLKDLIDAAKASPGNITLATAGLMTPGQFAGLALGKLAGVKFGIVNMEGSGPAVTALLGDHVDAASISAPTSLAQVKSGKGRVLAVTARGAELPGFPGVKTYEAQGYKVYQGAGWAVVAPGGTPKEIVGILNAAIKKVLDNPEFQKKMDPTQVLEHLTLDQIETRWTETEAEMKELLPLAQEQSK